MKTNKKYEYLCIPIIGGQKRTTKILNEYGKNGWELICTSWIWHYFKR